ncbi:MAG TPA: DUF1269 domain-containing protein [Cyclobacteriaceae bacterium]|nr:DUF1269 domain-containing protein [Cyclobacteriaceae bacterium]
MTNIIVASFTDEAKAIAAMHKLTELDSFGDISIYEKILVRKKVDGEVEMLADDNSEGWRTLAGMGVGSLLGVLGGPVGFLVGLYTGTVVGAAADMSHYGFAEDFIGRVKNKLTTGTVSIIAEIEEHNSLFINTSLKPFDAVITRSDVDLEFKQYVSDQIHKIEDDIANERMALKAAVGNERIKIQNKIAELKEKRKATIAGFLTTAKNVEKNIKEKTAAGFEQVESEVADFMSSISSEVNEERVDVIKRRIARYENKIRELNKRLEEMRVNQA